MPASIVVDFDVDVPMRDGTLLRANVYRPAQEGRWPVLLSRLPYGKDVAFGGSALNPIQTARSGYVVIVQDTRGRFASQGDFVPFETEADDGVDTIAWAADLPYSDGQVGMFGGSYLGFTQWSAAIKQPPALKTMVPHVTWSNPLDGLAFRGGALELGTTVHWSLLMGFDQLFRRYASDRLTLGQAIYGLAREVDQLGAQGYASLPLAEFGPLRRQQVAPGFFDRVSRPMDAESLAPLRIEDHHERATIPTFNVGGWFDIFLGGTIANYQAMRALGQPTKLLIGPWSHTSSTNPIGDLDFGIGSQLAMVDLQADFHRLQLRWFDHWLKGIDTGLLSEAPIKLFVMGANTWRDEQDWPLARAVETPFYLRSGGGLSRDLPAVERPDRYTYDPRQPVPTHGGALLMAPEFPNGPVDQRSIEARPDVLTYTTPPLDRDTEVTGPIRVQLWACSSAPDTDFVARLVDVYPDGRAINLTDGIVRARYRNGLSEAPIEPGQPYRFDIDLWATSNLFKAGHRIRLQVTSSNFPRWDRNPNTGHPFGTDSEADLRTADQTILHDSAHPSHAVLPIVPTG
jgi:putative CocE/NonD family hydrolase